MPEYSAGTLVAGSALASLGAKAASAKVGTTRAASASTDTLLIAYPGDIPTLNPGFAQQPTSQEPIRAIYSSLVDFGTKKGPKGLPVSNANVLKPLLAESYTVSKDGKTYTFHLRKGLLSQAGNELTTADVVWSFNNMFHGGGAGAFLLGTGAVTAPVTKALTVLDKYTFQVHAAQPTPLTLQVLYIWIESIMDSKTIKTHASASDPYPNTWLQTNSAGYGPYYVQNYTHGQAMTLVAKSNYPVGEPKLTTVVLQIINSASDRAAAIQQGAVDIAENLTYKDADGLKNAPGVTLISQPFSNYAYIGFNLTQKPLDDPRVRQALNYAMPVDEIIKTVYLGQADAATGYVPRSFPGASTYYPYHYNPAKAKALLKAAGVTNLSFPLPFGSDVPNLSEIAVIVQSAWKEIGVNITLKPLTASAYAGLLPPNKVTTPLWLETTFSVVPDSYYTLGLFFGSKGFHNFGKFVSPALDQALAAGAYEHDQAKRLSIIEKAQKPFVDAAPWAVACLPYFQIALRDNVKGFALYADGLTRYEQLSKV